MRKIIRYFVTYPKAVNILIMFFVVFGIAGIISLKSSFFPLIDSKFISIDANYPGASPEEIEEGVILKIEENLKGIPGVPEQDDANVTRQDILDNFEAFRFRSVADVDVYEKLLSEGFNLISKSLAALNQVFVDTKFEFGYVSDKDGNEKIIYMDEVGTPDSSRIWDGLSYQAVSYTHLTLPTSDLV